MNEARITVFAGHYGSGKTNIAVNYALHLKSKKYKTTICDLDIVNPYFRTQDGEKILTNAGIRLISSHLANTNVEAPGMPPEAVSLFDDKSGYGIIDVGGDDRGAYALGRYADLFEKEEEKNILLVINMFRPLTKSAESICEIMHEIQNAAHIKFNGIVNNSNLGNETTADDVISSMPYADDISKRTGLPIFMTTVRLDLLDEVKQKEEKEWKEWPDKQYLALNIIEKDIWRIHNVKDNN